ncbi:hypothetical protein Sarmat_01113 [Rickettsiales endosymbiont of Paramecium tredecaurelia]|nr:hypothetical protein [Candidatus Sarmatiella mevalonica]MBL3285241.1 hypothetical protein [Candidatus Sarmatiella mevalonica]
MSISYKKVVKHPRVFLRLFEIKVEEFDKILVFQLPLNALLFLLTQQV